MRTPVILDVNPDFESLDSEHERLRALGARTLRCLGPDTSVGCPVEAGAPCPKVIGADAVLCQLDLDCAHHRRLLEGYRRALGRRLTLVVAPDEATRWAELLDGIDVVVGPPSDATLRRLVQNLDLDTRDSKEA